MNVCLTPRGVPTLIGGLLLLSGLLDGCASSRLLKNPQPPTETDVGWAASSPEGTILEVHQLIFRNTGGSWVKNANWDEYVLTIRNDSEDAIEVQGISAISGRKPTYARPLPGKC